MTKSPYTLFPMIGFRQLSNVIIFFKGIFMKIETKYNYEKNWSVTNEQNLLKIIGDEVGDIDTQGTLSYVKEVIKNGKIITIGSCKFRKEQK